MFMDTAFAESFAAVTEGEIAQLKQMSLHSQIRQPEADLMMNKSTEYTDKVAKHRLRSVERDRHAGTAAHRV